MKKSMIEIAYDVLSEGNGAVKFLTLWDAVAKKMGFNQQQHDDNIAQFYSDLSLDGRFTSLPGNTWDLRKRQSRANAIVDTDALSVEDEEDEVLPVDDEDDEQPASDSDDEE